MNTLKNTSMEAHGTFCFWNKKLWMNRINTPQVHRNCTGGIKRKEKFPYKDNKTHKSIKPKTFPPEPIYLDRPKTHPIQAEVNVTIVTPRSVVSNNQLSDQKSCWKLQEEYFGVGHFAVGLHLISSQIYHPLMHDLASHQKNPEKDITTRPHLHWETEDINYSKRRK